IQRYSLFDGEGIRTNIFFKGCPLKCQWCNNPESIDPCPSIFFDERLCMGFGDCIRKGGGLIYSKNGSLVIERERIQDPGFLMNVCPTRAITVTGEEKSVDDILQEIVKDIPFYKVSGGGVTITGGEPFAQGPDLAVLLTRIKNMGINIAAETSLHLPWEKIEEYLDLVDIFLPDLKHTDPDKFFRFTGGDVSLVLNNLPRLDSTGKEYIVRIPVIPDFNFSHGELASVIDFVAQLGRKPEINFIPFHSLAKEKYRMLGRPYLFEKTEPVKKEELTTFKEYAESKGLKTKILN
ncbi:MAG: glycyl-radical enzyme activating protein, partial [Bacteroidales bacterium]|nr:glycyl-radical enzyme activating protein [Bacteroidales bacterium]